jgi:hypothetical protein
MALRATPEDEKKSGKSEIGDGEHLRLSPIFVSH